jgi:two-component system, OmpR family, alkaline phosphatase synthesis response regulator PhoP
MDARASWVFVHFLWGQAACEVKVTQPTPTSSLDGEARVLVLLDQPLVAEVVRLTLNHGVYVTQDARTLTDATGMLASWQPHLCVVDMDLGGDELLAQLGGNDQGGPRIPVIGLTRRGDLQTKLTAFDQGGDDILTMPFSPEELLARVLAVTRRTYGRTAPLQPVVQIGDLSIDILHRQVRVGSHDLHLTGLEQSLLYLLAANAGAVITRDQIMDALWGPDYIASSNIVDQHMRNLRAKLQNDWRHPRFIATVPGRGYRFIPRADE